MLTKFLSLAALVAVVAGQDVTVAYFGEGHCVPTTASGHSASEGTAQLTQTTCASLGNQTTSFRTYTITGTFPDNNCFAHFFVGDDCLGSEVLPLFGPLAAGLVSECRFPAEGSVYSGFILCD